MTRPVCIVSMWLALSMLSAGAHAEAGTVEIVHDPEASQLERLAAQEVRRYVYARTGSLLTIRTSLDEDVSADMLVIGTKDRDVVAAAVAEGELRRTIDQLAAEQYVMASLAQDDRQVVLLVGGDGVGTLYAAYQFAERLGIRFYLHGDVIPDQQVPLALADVLADGATVGKPLFATRGIQPFHDFPEGPDWWDAEDYKAIFAQLPKMRMNFFGLHTYPEGGVGPEPTVWIGQPSDIGRNGQVLASYPSRHFVTSNVTGAWGYQPRKTSDYAFGAAQMFERDDFGAAYMRDTFPWKAMNQDQSNALFNRFAAVLKDAFGFARQFGIKTCVGTETPLVIPQQVRQRLEAAGKSPTDPATVRSLYEGMFRRIMAAYPVDYYWLWTPEGWTWESVKQEHIDATLADFAIAEAAAVAVGAPFELATCGWVLGPPQAPALFDAVLPKSWPLSCINRNVGHDPVEPGFAAISGRPQWAIPWLEDDPAMILPQLWVGRMRKDAVDALRYGCNGLLGIHWRTRIVGPNVAALAQAAWSQEGWKTPAVDTDPPSLTGSFESRRVDYPAWRMAPCEDFYRDWAAAEFGARAGERIAPIFAQMDCRLPRPADWVDGPGGIVPDPRPWAVVAEEYAFVEELASLRPLVSGSGHRERFDYWLANFKYLRAMAKLNCTWAELNTALESLKQADDAAARKDLVLRKAMPLRIRLIRELTYVQQFLLDTVATKGEMGTVTNWQQHVFPLLLDPSEKAITEVTGEPLAGKATLPREYAGDPRLFVPVVRTSLLSGEPLRVDAVVMGASHGVAILFWRPLGGETFTSVPLSHVTRGVYRVEVPASALKEDFEYYLEFTLERKTLRFPPTAPELNQTVVLVAKAE
ncbi:MAG: hypothetical protein ACYC6N_19210 [Pirellulaceae bacterium]